MLLLKPASKILSIDNLRLTEEEMKLGVIEYIDCAHYLPGHEKCGTLHGHTYRIEVVIDGENQSGMIVDFAILKKSIKETLGGLDLVCPYALIACTPPLLLQLRLSSNRNIGRDTQPLLRP